MPLPAWLANVTLGQLIVLAGLGTPISGGVYWGLDKMIRNAVAEEKFVTQEALDEQKQLLENLEEKFQVYSKEQGILQADVGTVKQLQKDAKEDMRMILLGITNLQQN